MSGAAPEFSRLVPLVRIGAAPFEQEISATEEECATLAHRFGLLSLERLAARVVLERKPGDTILLSAEWEAAFTQECVVSLDPVPGSARERFELRYGPADAEGDDDAEAPAFELLESDAIDIGEAVAQEFSLSLPPFPHLPEAVLEIEEDPAGEGPFAVLERLKNPLDSR
ncbi:MAG TPA: YceD family protein [Stellaceae bacterium]|jgi:uncharacterized metal-binding protein YceD (DUF177 family)